MSIARFWLVLVAVTGVLAAAMIGAAANSYAYFAGYAVLQYIVLATAWNILGGYAGYVNFGTAAFFALGAYCSVALHKLAAPPLPVLILAGGLASGALGLAMGVLTLRLRGVFFSIATLALSIVMQALVTNWEYVGGSSGAYVLRPALGPLGLPYIQYLCLLMLVLAGLAVGAARTIERTRLGYGLATIRDDELAAEISGVPTLRLKLIATTISGVFMGMAGAPLPFYITYLDPASSFNLAYAVNSIAMPLIGGTGSWIGPVVGAVFLSTVQQAATVTISSSANLLIVGVLLVGFVALAPAGLVGAVGPRLRRLSAR